MDNLKDEGRVCGVIDRLLQYLESKGSTEEVCRVYLRRIMHTYYKFDYKAHRRSLGLQGETKVTGPYYIYLLNIRAVTITALPLHRGNEMPTAVLRSSPSSPHFFSGDPSRFIATGIKHSNGR